MEGDFFGKWDFVSANDPTHGFVDYVTAEKAVEERLARKTSNGTSVLLKHMFLRFFEDWQTS